MDIGVFTAMVHLIGFAFALVMSVRCIIRRQWETLGVFVVMMGMMFIGVMINVSDFENRSNYHIVLIWLGMK